MSSFGKVVRVVMALAAICMTGAMFSASANAADTTTWICKPGQADDLCAGTIAGTENPAPGQTAKPWPYTRPANPPIDCFYLYPTQSNQATPNANLDKDPEIRRVVVQQARMFSTICKVYAPMYHQVTFSGDQSHDSADVEAAYKSAKEGFQSYLDNYNDGRGFIMLGHSQGSAMTGRLIDEMVDKDAALRSKFVGAIAPGGDIYAPIGKDVGGMYDNVPACSTPGQIGCLTAFSTYKGDPGPTPGFSSLTTGYWIYPEARPDPSKFEVICTDPSKLDGTNGNLLPLANYDYLLDTPDSETATPWQSQPDYYNASCQRNASGAHYLNIGLVGTPGDSRLDLGSFVASGNNYHVPEVNLTEGNLLKIAKLQASHYSAIRLSDTQSSLAAAESKLTAASNTCTEATSLKTTAARKAAKASRKAAKAAKKAARAAKRAAHAKTANKAQRKAAKKAKRAARVAKRAARTAKRAASTAKRAASTAATKAAGACAPISEINSEVQKLQADVQMYTDGSQP